MSDVDKLDVSPLIIWFAENVEWVFSGIGTTIVSTLVTSVISMRFAWLAYKSQKRAKNNASETEKILANLKQSTLIGMGKVLVKHLDAALNCISGKKNDTNKYAEVDNHLSHFLSEYDSKSNEYEIVAQAQKNAQIIVVETKKQSPDNHLIDNVRNELRVQLQEASSSIKNNEY